MTSAGPRRKPQAARKANTISDAEAEAFSKALRRWFRGHGRDLPWRKTRDAYEVLVSELMLQQTQVSRVVTRYGEFLEEFPTLADVGRARPARVTEAWSGLGYYARARNLHRLAAEITDRGRDRDARLPADPVELKRLPGIGAYTAGAVASFAYERRAPLVDTNVGRVLERVFAPGSTIKTSAGAKRLWSIAERVLPHRGPTAWVHNQALMELGALVCTARVKRCGECPVRSMCSSAEHKANKR